jgi:hypothetical protein
LRMNSSMMRNRACLLAGRLIVSIMPSVLLTSVTPWVPRDLPRPAWAMGQFRGVTLRLSRILGVGVTQDV